MNLVCVSVCPRFSQPPKVPDSWNFGSRPILGQLKTKGRQVAQIRYRYREILEYYSWVLAHTRGYSSIESQYSRILKYWISVLVPTSDVDAGKKVYGKCVCNGFKPLVASEQFHPTLYQPRASGIVLGSTTLPSPWRHYSGRVGRRGFNPIGREP